MGTFGFIFCCPPAPGLLVFLGIVAALLLVEKTRSWTLFWLLFIPAFFLFCFLMRSLGVWILETV